MKRFDKLRIGIVMLVFFVSFALVVFRLFYWQVIRSPQLSQIGINQSTESLDIPAKRGDILTSDNYPIATTKVSYILYANPKVTKPDAVHDAEKLNSILHLDVATVSAQLSKNLYWVKLDDRVSIQDKTKIDKLNISGIGFQEDDLRFYPEASMAAHVIGFLGKDASGNNKGYFGLEGYYNDQLSGRDGKLYAIHDAFGNPILNDIRQENQTDGSNIVLSLDRTIQYSAEIRLKQGIAKYGAEGGSVIVMDPSTGKILAMASFPRFNPQSYYLYSDMEYKNPVISNVYEPGSTFKVIVMSSAIDLGLVDPDTRCDICSGPVQIGEYKIRTWNDQYFPNTTMTEVIQHSDNTGMVFVAQKLGVHDLLAYLRKFGIGLQTNIDLQGEISGDVKPESEIYPVDLATMGFGQGISVTPMELLDAVSAIANGGNLMRPYLVQQIVSPDGKSIVIKPEVRNRAISEQTAKVMTNIMVNAVENGEAKWTKLKHYYVAGKTGTAQIPIQGHYDPTQTIASFVGFFPPQDPKISMLVILNRPKTSIYGSETAAPIFFQIAQDIINYYNIPPDY